MRSAYLSQSHQIHTDQRNDDSDFDVMTNAETSIFHVFQTFQI